MDNQNQIPQEALRCRRLRLEHETPGTAAPALEGLIDWRPLPGARVAVTYDVRSITLEEIVTALRDQDIVVSDDRRSRWVIAWHSYLDRNARANLGNPGSPCCSNPTQIYASRKRR